MADKLSKSAPDEATVPTVPTDVEVPAFDTPSNSLSPLVEAARAAGATVVPHPTDPQKIVVTIADKDVAATFAANVENAIKAG